MRANRIVLLATVPAAVLLASCSGGAPTAAPASAAASASDAMAEGKDMAKVGTSVPASELGAQITKAEEAAKTVTVDSSGGGGSGTSQFDTSTTPYSAAMHVPGPPTVDMIMLDGTIYMKGDAINSMIPGGKTWLSVPPGGTVAGVGDVGSLLEPSIPSALIGPLLKELGSVPFKVTDSSDSALTYEGTMTEDEQLVALRALTSDDSVYDKLPKGSFGSSTITITVGADSLPTKATVKSKTGTQSSTFRDWGKPVDIAAPPAAETYTAK